MNTKPFDPNEYCKTHDCLWTPTELLARPGISPGAKLCWAWLDKYAEKNETCSTSALARHLGKSVCTVRRYLAALEAAGFIGKLETPPPPLPPRHRDGCACIRLRKGTTMPTKRRMKKTDPDGWARAFRKWLDSPIFLQYQPAVAKVALYFTLRAGYKPTQWWDGGSASTFRAVHSSQATRRWRATATFLSSKSATPSSCSNRTQFASYVRTHRYSIVTVLDLVDYEPSEEAAVKTEERTQSKQKSRTRQKKSRTQFRTNQNTVGSRARRARERTRRSQSRTHC